MTNLMGTWLSTYMVMLCEKTAVFCINYMVICDVITHLASIRPLWCHSPFFFHFYLRDLRGRHCEHRARGGPGVLRQPVCMDRVMLDTGDLVY